MGIKAKAIVALSSLAAFATIAFAQSQTTSQTAPPPQQGQDQGRGMRERLGITSEQAAKINQQETDFQKAGIQNRATLETKHVEMQQLMSSDHPDRAGIDKKLAEISAAQLAQEQTNVHHQLDMKNYLNLLIVNNHIA